jgi:hypothetical protein
MSDIMEGLDAAALLGQLPSSMRASLETLERAGTDWNAVGTLLVGSPTAGVALAGTGQWTTDLWDAVKWEFRSFLCTESESYDELRAGWDALRERSPTLAVRALAARVAERIGVTGGVVAPLVTWLLVVAHRMGKDALCLALSTVSSTGAAEPWSPPHGR